MWPLAHADSCHLTVLSLLKPQGPQSRLHGAGHGAKCISVPGIAPLHLDCGSVLSVIIAGSLAKTSFCVASDHVALPLHSVMPVMCLSDPASVSWAPTTSCHPRASSLTRSWRRKRSSLGRPVASPGSGLHACGWWTPSHSPPRECSHLCLYLCLSLSRPL